MTRENLSLALLMLVAGMTATGVAAQPSVAAELGAYDEYVPVTGKANALTLVPSMAISTPDAFQAA